MKFADKFSLTPAQSVFLAKKKWDENVYCGMMMENRVVTFSQVKTILCGVNVPAVSMDDVQAILNMHDAWKFLLATIDTPLSIDYICQLNGHIARNESIDWGVLRYGNVGVTGTEYDPPIPDRSVVERELEAILGEDTSATEKALNVFAWGARGQFFWDGNKRTSMTAANKILVSAGAGVLTINDKHMLEFTDKLIRYYDTGDATELKLFLYRNAITGMTIQR